LDISKSGFLGVKNVFFRIGKLQGFDLTGLKRLVILRSRQFKVEWENKLIEVKNGPYI
jgi:hypothetical protein